MPINAIANATLDNNKKSSSNVNHSVIFSQQNAGFSPSANTNANASVSTIASTLIHILKLILNLLLYLSDSNAKSLVVRLY